MDESLSRQVPYLSAAFLEGTYVKIGGTNLQVRIIDIGDLALPSGRVIVADPFAFVDPEPLTLKVQPGQYPIPLSLVD